jgi:molybdopterin converting factor small subunit
VITVNLSTHFRAYTNGKKTVEASGNSVNEILSDLNRKYNGIKFRIINEQDEVRHHIKIFKNSQQIDNLNISVSDKDVIHIIGALSGG